MKAKDILLQLNKVCRHGIWLTYAGALTLVVGLLFGWTNSNALLAISVIAVVVGAVLHVISIKKESAY